MAWYECKVTHDVMIEDCVKTLTEPYLVEALSVTEAATRITAELEGDGDGTIESVTRKRFQEVFLEEGEWEHPFYLTKVALTTLDEKSGTESEQTFCYLIEAETLKDAMQRLEAELRGGVSDWELLSLSKSPIVEVVTAEKKEGAAV
mgnify:FL=1|jgi:hypothetical protein